MFIPYTVHSKCLSSSIHILGSSRAPATQYQPSNSQIHQSEEQIITPSFDVQITFIQNGFFQKKIIYKRKRKEFFILHPLAAKKTYIFTNWLYIFSVCVYSFSCIEEHLFIRSPTNGRKGTEAG